MHFSSRIILADQVAVGFCGLQMKVFVSWLTGVQTGNRWKAAIDADSLPPASVNRNHRKTHRTSSRSRTRYRGENVRKAAIGPGRGNSESGLISIPYRLIPTDHPL